MPLALWYGQDSFARIYGYLVVLPSSLIQNYCNQVNAHYSGKNGSEARQAHITDDINFHTSDLLSQWQSLDLHCAPCWLKLVMLSCCKLFLLSLQMFKYKTYYSLDDTRILFYCAFYIQYIFA